MFSNLTGHQQRDHEAQQLEKKKQEIEKELERRTKVKFQSIHRDIVEEEFKNHTVGLVTREEYSRKAQNIGEILAEQNNAQKEQQLKELQIQKLKRKREIARKQNILSFNEEEGEEDEEYQQQQRQQEEADELESAPADGTAVKSQASQDKIGSVPVKKIKKNPDIDSKFLPDQDREEQERLLRERLRQEFLEKKQKLLTEDVELNVQYYDGFKVVKKLRCKYRTTIGEFLKLSKLLFLQEYPFLKKIITEDLIFVVKNYQLQHKWSLLDVHIRDFRSADNEPLFNLVKDEADGCHKDPSNVILFIDKKKLRGGDEKVYPFVNNIY